MDFCIAKCQNDGFWPPQVLLLAPLLLEKRPWNAMTSHPSSSGMHSAWDIDLGQLSAGTRRHEEKAQPSTLPMTASCMAFPASARKDESGKVPKRLPQSQKRPQCSTRIDTTPCMRRFRRPLATICMLELAIWLFWQSAGIVSEGRLV